MLVKGGPGERRRFLDDAMIQLRPRDDALRLELERVLRQRNTLLKQSGGRLSEEVAVTLDVWDQKLAAVGTEIGARRAEIAEAVAPHVAAAYQRLAGHAVEVEVVLRPSWAGAASPLAALAACRPEDLRRRVSTVGPHHDEVELVLGGLSARTQASQGEQRSLALALRLGVHHLVAERVGEPPVLLLDDVFSELDPAHSRALVELLPGGQALLTTAGGLPEGVAPDLVVPLAEGRVQR